MFCIHDDCIYGKKGRIFADATEEILEDDVEEGTGGANADQVEPQIPAHLLSHHLKYECTSKGVKQRFLLIERSRQRHPYPRPWGICIDCNNVDDK